MNFITTSWDDGHPLDIRLATLLEKYQLPATFYIPRSNPEQEVMTVSQLKKLSEHFEIGAHTLNHTRLERSSEQVLQQEIGGSFTWLKELTGRDPICFCFPGGKFSPAALSAVFKAGFKVARTTELLHYRTMSGSLLPTTLQLYPHSAVTYARHLVKRGKWMNLVTWLSSKHPANLTELAKFYLHQVEINGGCFHLWGHSWEIEKYRLWKPLEEIFKLMANRPGFQYVPNSAFATGQLRPFFPAQLQGNLIATKQVNNVM